MGIVMLFENCNLKRTSIAGLKFLFKWLIREEKYEQAAFVRDEINKRNQTTAPHRVVWESKLRIC